MTTSTHGRGFSLIELIIALGMSALVIIAAMLLMVGQQRAFRSGSDDRALQEVARVALSRLTADLRLAGYGVDPALAFDFGPMTSVRMERAPTGQVVDTASYLCADGPGCRDRIDGPDEVVFYARDPMFGKVMRGAASVDALTISGPLNVPLRAGQVLLVVCSSPPMTWAYVTVGRDVAPTTATKVEVSLESGDEYNFPHQNKALTDPCFSNSTDEDPPYDGNTVGIDTAAKVTKIDRYRYFVERYGDKPYLMLDRGGGPDKPELEVIAPDIEDIQFSYVFPNATQVPLVGATPDVLLKDEPGTIELVAPVGGFPGYGDTPRSASQANHQAGNIRAVRVSMVVRSPVQDTTRMSDTAIPAAANRHALVGDGGYQRMLIETTIPTPNLGARAPSFPSWGTAAEHMNVGGG